jgi:SAM-dependent methyltransferase
MFPPANQDTADFYDLMAPWYHLVYQDWNGSIERQAEQLASIIEQQWGLPEVKSVLDVSCGIGTQALGLAQRGFQVTASDLSGKAIARAREEADQRGIEVNFSVCDMREAYLHHHRRQFDLVISCDNSITHLLSDDDILLALGQMYRCTRPGGGCIITVRDYASEERGMGIVKPYGIREVGERVIVFQVWDFVGDIYDLAMYFIVDNHLSEHPVTHAMRSKYYAIGTSRLLDLMRDAGFSSVQRLDEVFLQPVLVGTVRENSLQ